MRLLTIVTQAVMVGASVTLLLMAIRMSMPMIRGE